MTLILVSAKAQKIKDYTGKFDKEPFLVELEIKKKDRVSVSGFNKIDFIDARADSSFMGFVLIDIWKPHRKITFPLSKGNYLKNKLNDAFLPGKLEKTLIIKLNDLWFNQTVTQAGWLEGTILGPEKNVGTCFFNADIFVQSGKTISKIGNIDTTFIKKGWLPPNCDDLLKSAIKHAIAYGDQNVLLTNQNADTMNATQFDVLSNLGALLPILKDEKLNKGIYFSFKDFLNNKPKPMPFEMTEAIRSYYVSYKPPADVSSDTAWGVCDGQNIYIHLDKKYYQFTRVNNSFEVYAPETIEIINTFAGKIFESSLTYLVDPIKIFAVEPLLRPSVETYNYFRRYYLNILNGSLR